MAKDNPKWFGTSPSFVAHPATTLKTAAQVIRARAKKQRATGDTYTAGITQEIATRLERVALGDSWEDAFGLVVAPEEAQP